MRVSFSSGTFYHRPLAYSLALARAVGFDGVEYVVGLDYFLRGLAPLQRAIATTGVPVLSIHPPFPGVGRLPFTGWPRSGVRAWPRVTALGRELGAEVAVTHTVFLAQKSGPRAARYAAALWMGRQAGRGLALTIESNQYNRRKRRYLLDDLPTLVRYAQDHGCGVTFDTCHAGANGQDILECYEILRPVLQNVHLSDVIWRDGQPHTHALPGEGSLPLDQLLERMVHDGYDGLVTLEVHPWYASMYDSALAERRMRQALAYVRAACGEALPSPTTA